MGMGGGLLHVNIFLVTIIQAAKTRMNLFASTKNREIAMLSDRFLMPNTCELSLVNLSYLHQTSNQVPGSANSTY
jgi:hypothetical protein